MGTLRDQKSLDQATELCKEVVDLCGQLPERAEGYADSVIEKAESIQQFVEDNGVVTEAQLEALDNMKAGAEKWLT